MKLFRAPWKQRVPDDKFIEQLRRSIESWDRWRFWLIPFHIGLIVILGWLYSGMIAVLIGMAQPANPQPVLWGFVAGTTVGMAFGWMFSGLLHNLTSALGELRAERMLLEYVDAHGLEPEQQQDQEAEPDEFRDPVRGPQGHPSAER